MKKILALIFMIMLFCQACFAFEQPDPNQWVFIEDNGTHLCWVDAPSVRFSREYYGPSAKFQLMLHNKNNGITTISRLEMNLEGRQCRTLGVIGYYENGQVDTSDVNTSTPFETIDLRTLQGDVYMVIMQVYEMQKDQHNV